MSVIIPNMKMPMSCLACPLAREMFNCLVCVGYFKDNLTGRRVYKSDSKESDADFNRPDWCPIVPFPEGHGELIDKQAFIADIDGFIECMTSVGAVVDGEMLLGKLLDALDNAKTIVPAEGGMDDEHI